MSSVGSNVGQRIQVARDAEPGAINRLLDAYRNYLRTLARVWLDRSLQQTTTATSHRAVAANVVVSSPMDETFALAIRCYCVNNPWRERRLIKRPSVKLSRLPLSSWPARGRLQQFETRFLRHAGVPQEPVAWDGQPVSA